MKPLPSRAAFAKERTQAIFEASTGLGFWSDNWLEADRAVVACRGLDLRVSPAGARKDQTMPRQGGSLYHAQSLEVLCRFLEAELVTGEWRLEASLPIPGALAGNTRFVDALCVVSRNRRPKVEEMFQLGASGTGGGLRIGRLGLWKQDRKNQNVDGERVSLVEIKSGRGGITDAAIGQLLVYAHLFRRGWPNAAVDSLWLIGRSVQDSSVRAICDSLGIRIWTSNSV